MCCICLVWLSLLYALAGVLFIVVVCCLYDYFEYCCRLFGLVVDLIWFWFDCFDLRWSCLFALLFVVLIVDLFFRLLVCLYLSLVCDVLFLVLLELICLFVGLCCYELCYCVYLPAGFCVWVWVGVCWLWIAVHCVFSFVGFVLLGCVCVWSCCLGLGWYTILFAVFYCVVCWLFSGCISFNSNVSFSTSFSFVVYYYSLG